MSKEVNQEEYAPRTIADVKEMLSKHSNGEIQRTIRNCELILQNDHVLANAIRLNLLSERIDIVKPVGWPRSGKALNDTDMKYILRRMEKYGISSEKKIESAIRIVANENRYHPIRDYLNSLKWDGTERIAHVLHHFLGAAVLNPQLLEKYAGARITAWLDKSYDPKGARWQTNNSLYAIGSGGLFGTGLGNSKQKHLYVSEPQNDFIFAIVCEELGFIRAVGIILLYVLLVWRGVVIGLKAKDRFGAMLAMGIVFQVGLQTALNIGVVTDTLPNTGISLPFFSYGGTSLMMLLVEMGIVLSVSRYSRIEK